MQYYSQQNNIKCLITNYDKDLSTLINVWIDDGHQIILMLDSNEDITKKTKDSFRSKIERAGLRELILHQHTTLPPPPTQCPGKRTIENIFSTPSMDVANGGYGSFVGFTDHRLAWIDINWESVFGTYQKIERPPARRLQCEDPRTVKKCLLLLQKYLDDENIDQIVINLQKNATILLSARDTEIYETVDKIITNYMIKAEKKCRKLFMAGVPYSPELAEHLNRINLWCLLIRKKKRNNSNMRTIILLQKKYGVNGRLLELNISEIYQQYKECI